MTDRCLGCSSTLSVSKGAIRNWKLSSLSSPYTTKRLFGRVLERKGRLCHECHQELISKTISVKTTHKRRWPWSKTPLKRRGEDSPDTSRKRQDIKTEQEQADPDTTNTIAFMESVSGTHSDHVKSEEQPMSVEPEPAPRQNIGHFKRRACHYINESLYENVFHVLLRESPSAKKAFVKVYGAMVKKEMRNVRGEGHFKSLIGPLSDHRALQDVQWDAVVSEGRELTPFLAEAFDNALPPTEKIGKRLTKGRKGENRPLNSSEKEAKRTSIIGLMYSMVLFTHLPSRYCLIPSIIGVHLWMEGASFKTFRCLNYLSISQGRDSARHRIDSLGKGHKDHLLSLKSEAEEQNSGLKIRSLSTKSAGYSFCFDRVQFTTQSRPERKPVSHTVTMAFAAEHRIKSTRNLARTVSSCRQAEDLLPQTFIATPYDFKVLKDYMIVVVKRTVLSFIPALKHLQSGQKTVVCHEHTDDMTQKSNILNLGIIEGNPSSVPDVLDHLTTYVPNDAPNLSFAVPIHGKAEIIDTIINAKKDRSPSGNETRSFRNFVEVGHEYHKEGLLMEDALKMHLSDTSQSAHGSLYHVKNFFKLLYAIPPVMSHFKDVWTLLQHNTEGLTVLLAMKLSNMTSIDDVPEDFPDNRILQNKWLNNICSEIVDYIWKQPSSDEIKCIEEGYKRKQTLSQDTDDSDGNFPFCFCNEDREDEMVRCCNSRCQIARVHYQCCRPPLTAAPVADWYCSDECEESPHYIYCFCQETQDGANMIQCHSQDKCLRYEWYHLSCLGLTSDELPDEWYCSDKCALGEEHDDAVLEYTKSLLWTGLNLLVRRDIVREGNGPLMLQMWRLDILQFWQNHHDTSLKMAHRLLAYTGGFLPPAVAYDITWNRVVNVDGQKASNIGMDLENEFLNNDFKEMIQHGGHYSSTQFQRCSQVGGAFKLDLHRILMEDFMFGVSESLQQHQHTYTTTEQVESFVQEYQGDALFDYCPPREHNGFSGFRHNESLTSPYKLGGVLKLHSLELDQ